MSNRLKSMLAVLFLGSGLAALVWYLSVRPSKPSPTAPGYYTGPFRNKGDSSILATEDGKVTNAENAESAVSQNKPAQSANE